MLTLTRKFTFEMAHALSGYDGGCRHIHGHSYKLFVTVEGTPSDDSSSPKLGMVIDFTDIKRLVNTHIVDNLDHALMLKSDSVSDSLMRELKERWKVVEVDYQPTCENLIVDMYNTLSKVMPSGVKLYELRLYETENSYATYRP